MKEVKQKVNVLESDMKEVKQKVNVLESDMKEVKQKVNVLELDMSAVKATSLVFETDYMKKIDVLFEVREVILEKLDNLNSEFFKSNKRIEKNTFTIWQHDARLSSLEKKVN